MKDGAFHNSTVFVVELCKFTSHIPAFSVAKKPQDKTLGKISIDTDDGNPIKSLHLRWIVLFVYLAA